MTVRVRIAPSPTGDPHVGTAYIAIFNLLFAKRHQGSFILRIEDTDAARCNPQYETAIMDSLKWLGLTWDEGPDIGGKYGPYRQSNRTEIYKKHAFELVEKKYAYKCFATQEELAVMKQFVSVNRRHYDGRYRHLDPDEIKRKELNGDKFVIRLKVPRQGKCIFEDMIRGKISFPWEDVDDQILLKSDGRPTYHLANVVDDHYMKITHVIRGDEWVSSTPKHVLIYEAFGWQSPKFCHLPLLVGPDGKKLSKRKNHTSIFFYKDSGYIPQALTNFLMLIGYCPKDGNEITSIEETAKDFDLNKLGKSASFFDTNKLNWINQYYLNLKMSEEEILSYLKTWRFNDNFIKKIIPLAKSRIKTLSDFFEIADFLFSEKLTLTHEILCPKEVFPKKASMIIQTLIWELDERCDWSGKALEETSKLLAEEWTINYKKIIIPILFGSLMGKRHGLPMFHSFDLLGKFRSRARFMNAITALGGLSNDETVKLKKAWETQSLKDLH